MTQNIFAHHAPFYWAAGLPAIPLHYQEKRPIMTSWQRYADTMPTGDEQQAWLNRYPDANIGLPLGPASNIVVLDVDTDNAKILEALDGFLPKSPWKRIGKKGYVVAFRYNGTKTFRIKNYAGQSLIEHLSTRTQVVLPPSIHPDTKQPYTSNSNLWEVAHMLPVLSPEIENLLRGMLTDLGENLSTTGWTRVTDWVPAGARDVTMIKIAGMYAHAVLRGERNLIEAIDMLRAWANDRVEHVVGDELDIEKGVRSLVQFLLRDVNEKGLILPAGWDEGLTKEDKNALGLFIDADNEEWTVDQLEEYLHDQFSNHPKGAPQRNHAVEFVLRKLAKSARLSSLEREKVLRYIFDTAGLGVPTSALRKRMNELARGDFEGLNHTAIAQRVLEDIKAKTNIKFFREKFWEWNGSHWQEYDQTLVMQHIASEYGTHPAAKKHNDHRGICAIMSTLTSEDICQHPVKGVNFANGVLLETGELVPHNPMYGFQYTLPFRYLPEASRETEQFQAFLHRSWGSDADYEAKLAALQEALCVTVFGMAPVYQRAFLLYGPPKTGKSQLLDIIQTLVPEEGRTCISPEEWGDQWKPAEMAGKVLNYCGELSETKQIDGKQFKEIIDGTEMTVQKKFRDPFQIRPTCAHWFGSNYLPKTGETSAAFNRRWLIFRFDHPIKDHEKVPMLGQKIGAEEREGIVAWAIQALPRIQKNREYTIPGSHNRYVAEMARGNNSVRFFIEESDRVELVPILSKEDGMNPSNRTSESALFSAYSFFSTNQGVAKPVGRMRFRMMMDDMAANLGLTIIEEKKQVYYIGLTLVEKLVA